MQQGLLVLPDETKAALAYLDERLREVVQAIHDLEEGFFKERHAAPMKLIERMFAFADGTDWNPGSGQGLYQLVGGVWQKL